MAAESSSQLILLACVCVRPRSQLRKYNTNEFFGETELMDNRSITAKEILRKFAVSCLTHAGEVYLIETSEFYRFLVKDERCRKQLLEQFNESME